MYFEIFYDSRSPFLFKKRPKKGSLCKRTVINDQEAFTSSYNGEDRRPLKTIDGS
jgi:hypothetical protein